MTAPCFYLQLDQCLSVNHVVNTVGKVCVYSVIYKEINLIILLNLGYV
jgi:hypothetical protein